MLIGGVVLDLKIDFTLTLSILIAVIALVSPIITTVINNRHQLKLKKIDMYEEAKRKALSEFIENAQEYLLKPSYIEPTVKYYSSLDKLFLYFTDIDLNTFTPFDKASKNTDDYSTATIELTKIVQALSKQIAKE